VVNLKKRFLFVFSCAPHASLRIQEHMDMLLTAAAFEQSVGVLFIDDGVMLLTAKQNPEVIGCRDIAAILNSLPIYDVEDLYVEEESFGERGLQLDAVQIPVSNVSRSNLGPLLGSYDLVVNC